MPTLSARRTARLRRPLGAVLLAVVGAAGCRDAASDPLAVLVAAETRGALALRSELPALPDLAARAGMTERLDGPLGLWEASWDADGPDEARELREEAYRRSAPVLADALGSGEVGRLLADMGLALRAVATLDGLEPDLQAEVTRARALQRRAERALSRGEAADAWALEMEASDALRAIAPPVVAQSLLAHAEVALAAGADTLPETERDRAHRLVDGARRAVETEDWPRAIRRAFYASQLLGHPGR